MPLLLLADLNHRQVLSVPFLVGDRISLKTSSGLFVLVRDASR